MPPRLWRTFRAVKHRVLRTAWCSWIIVLLGFEMNAKNTQRVGCFMYTHTSFTILYKYMYVYVYIHVYIYIYRYTYSRCIWGNDIWTFEVGIMISPPSQNALWTKPGFRENQGFGWSFAGSNWYQLEGKSTASIGENFSSQSIFWAE